MITLEDLHWNEIKSRICDHCGACVPFCDWEKCKNDKNKIDDQRLGKCDICYLFCPRTSSSAINYKTTVKSNFSTNSVKSVEVAKNGQDGSFVTTLTKYLLRDKLVDAVILTGKNEEWKPIPFIATTEADIERASGSKYSVAPAPSLIKEATEKFEKIAFVGVPCQIRALRNMQLQKKHDLKMDRIILAIGLFCRENFEYDKLKDFVENEGIKMADVKKFDISAGKFKIYTDSGVVEKPVRNLDRQVWAVCHSCIDFASDFSDLSAGSVGSKKGFTTVLIRTDNGYEMFRRMLEKNLFEIEPEVDLALIEKLSNDKKKNIENLSDEVKNILLC